MGIKEAKWSASAKEEYMQNPALDLRKVHI